MIVHGNVVIETGVKLENRVIQGVVRKGSDFYGYTRLLTRTRLVAVQLVSSTGDWKIVDNDQRRSSS